MSIGLSMLSHKMKFQLYFLVFIAQFLTMSVSAVSITDGSTNITNGCVTYLYELESSLKSNALN